MRKTTALLAAFAILAGLTACSGSDTVAGCAPTYHSGAASTVVKAPGKFNKAPKVTFPTPLHTNTTQKSTIKTGTGAVIQNGQPVVLDVSIVNATTGDVLQQSSYASGGGSLLTAGKSDFAPISRGMECSTIGSRIAVVASPKDAHSGKADPTNGIKKNDAFVYVIDIKRAFPAKADGAVRAPQDSFPSVVTTANGTPGITIPTTSAPKSLETEVLKQGSGAKVKKNHIVVVKYTAVTWSSPSSSFDSTWTTGQASVLQPGATSVSPGLSKALIGQRVGTQLLTVIPPKQAASADGNGLAPAGATVVYVVDILGIAS